jgi:NADPH:quinone reductase-like Zn-dependent oxidoreductase
VSSAAGGIGTHLIEYLLKLGYKNIFGIAGSDKKCEFVEKLGAKKCINYNTYLKE